MKKKKRHGAPDARGMRGIRSRVKSTGRLRKKRSDTSLKTIERIYGKRSLRKLVSH